MITKINWKSINKKELKIGIKVELEHTKSRARAKKIAAQHLTEFGNYYTKGLLPMEKKLKALKKDKWKHPDSRDPDDVIMEEFY